MAVSLGEAILKIGADSSTFERKLARLQGLAKKHMDGAANAVLASTKTLMLGAAGAIAAGVATIIGSVKFGAELADRMDEMSQRTGLAAKSLMEYSAIMELAGGSAESLEVAIKKMQKAVWGKGEDGEAEQAKILKGAAALDKRANDAATRFSEGKMSGEEYNALLVDLETQFKELTAETEKNAAAFQRLGLVQKDLQDMDQEAAFKTILTALAGIPNAGERAALALQVFGKSGTTVLPLIANGVEDLNEQLAEAKRRTVAATPTTARLADEFATLGQWVNSVRMMIANALSPEIEKYILIAQDWIASNRELIAVKVKEYVDAIGAAAQKAWPHIRDTAFFLWEHKKAIGQIVLGIEAAALAWKGFEALVVTSAVLKILAGAGAGAALKGGAAGAGGSLLGALGTAALPLVVAIAAGSVVGVYWAKSMKDEMGAPQKDDPWQTKAKKILMGAGGRAVTPDEGQPWYKTYAKVIDAGLIPLALPAGILGRMTVPNTGVMRLGRGTGRQGREGQITSRGESGGNTTINIQNFTAQAADILTAAKLEWEITKQAAKKLP